MYTTHLSTLISSPSLDHRLYLYADDAQLFFSFYPLNFDSSISHLQNTLQQISSWITAYLITLNSSKTEFLFIGLKSQLAKNTISRPYNDKSSFDTSHCARNLGFIFNLTTLLLYRKTCYYHIRQLRCIRHLLTGFINCL